VEVALDTKVPEEEILNVKGHQTVTMTVILSECGVFDRPCASLAALLSVSLTQIARRFTLTATCRLFLLWYSITSYAAKVVFALLFPSPSSCRGMLFSFS
jgi:hypothetical protein